MAILVELSLKDLDNKIPKVFGAVNAAQVAKTLERSTRNFNGVFFTKKNRGNHKKRKKGFL
jgi:hypothetical protein